MTNKTPFERFMEKVAYNHTTGCLLWQSSKVNGGYGRFKYKGKTRLAHRWATAKVQANNRRPRNLTTGHFVKWTYPMWKAV